MSKKTSEEALLKALDSLEESVLAKSEDGADESYEDEASEPARKSMPKTVKEANGGMSKEGSTEEVEVSGDESSSVTKSLVDDNEDVQAGFEVSDFLKSFADVMVEAAELQTGELSKALIKQDQRLSTLSKAVHLMGNMMVEMKEMLSAQGDQPAHAPRTVLSKSEVAEREFLGDQGQQTTFSKGQVLNALTDMVMKGECDPLAVTAYETTQFLPDNLVASVNQRLGQMYGRR